MQTFKIVEDDEYTNIEIFIDGERVGYISFRYIPEAFYLFEDDFDEDEYYELFPEDSMVSLDILHIEPSHRRKGYARLLVKESIRYISNHFGNTPIYLNASSMDRGGGLTTQSLVSFYKSFGFQVILDEGENVLMIKN